MSMWMCQSASRYRDMFLYASDVSDDIPSKLVENGQNLHMKQQKFIIEKLDLCMCIHAIYAHKKDSRRRFRFCTKQSFHVDPASF